MDPLHPILPGAMPISARLPVQPLERVSRERDRPAKDGGERRRREPPPERHEQDGEDEDGRPRVDVRV